jgi:hypothetical protein
VTRSFICSGCQEPVMAGGVERRLEFRRLNDQGRYATRNLGRVCEGCADQELARLERPAPPPSTDTLFDAAASESAREKAFARWHSREGA